MRHDTRNRDAAALPSGVHGAADPHFGCAVRGFAAMFGPRHLGGGALAVYLDGRPVVDVWTGWSDRAGRSAWSADTGAMVFSATKGLATTVIHRLADRGLLEYDAPVARYWKEFGAGGKAAITVRQLMGHRAGLAGLHGAGSADVLDHLLMEQRLAAARPARLLGKPAYHALTYGWLMSGLARAVTGRGMRELIRSELARPLGTDGLHLGRPPAKAPTRAAQIIMPQRSRPNALFDLMAPRLAATQVSAAFGAMYVPGMKAFLQGDTPLLDTEAPAVNGVVTARALARMYAAIANDGRLDGTAFLSRDLVAGLAGRWNPHWDRNIGMPLGFHLGYHSVPVPGVMPGFGHVGLGGSIGWADPATGLAFAFVHNRLLSPFLLTDQSAFVALDAVIRRAATAARADGLEAVEDFGAPFGESGAAVG